MGLSRLKKNEQSLSGISESGQKRYGIQYRGIARENTDAHVEIDRHSDCRISHVFRNRDAVVGVVVIIQGK